MVAGVVLRSGNGSGICLNMSSATPPSVRSYRSSGAWAPHRHVIRSEELLPVPVTLIFLLTAACAVFVLSAAGPKRGEPSQMLSCVVVVTFPVLAQVAVEVLVVAVIIHAVPRRAVPVCFSFSVLPVVAAALSTDVSSGRLSLVAMFPWWQSSVIHLHYLLVLEVEGECSFLWAQFIMPNNCALAVFSHRLHQRYQASLLLTDTVRCILTDIDTGTFKFSGSRYN